MSVWLLMAWSLSPIHEMAPPGDTVSLSIPAALERARDVSPLVAAAGHRLDAASARAAQARAWTNPFLSVNAENLGQHETAPEVTGFEGIEGQAVFTVPLPLGPERSGRIGVTRADAEVANAEFKASLLDVSVAAVEALAGHMKASVDLETAREEARSLEEFARVLRLQADEGRSSEGDAARAVLAHAMAKTALGRAEQVWSESSAMLAWVLDYPAGTLIDLSEAPCSTAGSTGDSTDGLEDGPPELLAAQASIDRARSAARLEHGLRVPDLAPQVGLRRIQGENALFLGLSTALPLFNRGSKAVAAADSELTASEVNAEAVRTRLTSRLWAGEQTVAALRRAGESFSAEWFAALDRTVTAAQARYDAGEGFLFELLDARQARIRALSDHARWTYELRVAESRLARLRGATPGAHLFCSNAGRAN